MIREIDVRIAPARTLAAARRRVRLGEVGSAWRAPLDDVWAFLRANPGLRTDGHNVFVYHHPASRGEPMDVDFGVEVVRPFEAAGDVRAVTTPAGRVVSAVHVGPYGELRHAHDAIHAWAAREGERFAGVSWEIYDDPSPDASANRTRVEYLLAPRVVLVVAAAENGVIGREGKMPWHIREDLQRFKRLTLGHPVVMGRKTWESLGKPLPGRVNLVVTRQPGYQAEGARVVASLDDALALAAKDDPLVFVIGGGEIYRQALPRADRVELTRVRQRVEGDATFPDLGPEWRETAREEHDGYAFLTYEKA